MSRNRRNRDDLPISGGAVLLGVGGRFEGAPLLLLTTTGARSGRPLTTPVAYATDGDRLLIFATNAGREPLPAWYHNVRAHPSVVVDARGATPWCWNARSPSSR